MTRDVEVQTQISFVHTWSLTDDTGAYVNASSGTVLWSEPQRRQGGADVGVRDDQRGHQPKSERGPLGYSGFR